MGPNGRRLTRRSILLGLLLCARQHRDAEATRLHQRVKLRQALPLGDHATDSRVDAVGRSTAIDEQQLQPQLAVDVDKHVVATIAFPVAIVPDRAPRIPCSSSGGVPFATQ